jgi:hypothetical protein
VCFLVAYAVALDRIQSWDVAKVFHGSAAMMPTAFSDLTSSICLQAECCYGNVRFQRLFALIIQTFIYVFRLIQCYNFRLLLVYDMTGECGSRTPAFLGFGILCIDIWCNSLNGGSAHRKASAYRGKCKYRNEKYTHPYDEWDSNPPTQCSSGQSYYTPWIMRPF